ncbi:MAG: DUF4142 domain-containing protein [Proteobacteria bacterium]|nr:DUF4142 domain-containing protein [Pseudomonadota bacterium]
MKITKYLALFLLAVGLCGFVPQAEAAPASSMTRNFIRNATISNGFEIMSSRMALQRSQNPEVRNYAQQMIEDHRQADEDLRNTVMSSRYRMRGMANDLDQRHRSMLKRLERASVQDFDWNYVRMQTQAHDEAVQLFRSYANHGGNPTLRDFAERMLPTLEEHQHHVRQIRFYR